MKTTRHLKASKAVGARNYNLAIEEYEKILEKDEKDQLALTMLAHCYEKKDDKICAYYASRVLEQDPDDFEMLMLSARFWSELGDEDRSYNYACRVVKNAPQPYELPPWVLKVLKVLSKFKKFRGLENKAVTDWTNHEHYKKDGLEWARQYKAWYESQHPKG